jgi:hypothetical protein
MSSSVFPEVINGERVFNNDQIYIVFDQAFDLFD